jgi:uridine kinase
MAAEAVTRDAAPVIVLDGAYSARPEISDLISLSVLVDLPAEERHRRMGVREEDRAFVDAWHARWDVAEDYHFTHVRPPASFDLVVAVSA